jgi:hypothetical protein
MDDSCSLSSRIDGQGGEMHGHVSGDRVLLHGDCVFYLEGTINN